MSEPSTFQSVFFPGDNAVRIRVPDYQRAYSWELKQVNLFIGDLVKYQGEKKGYYFGHFIAEDGGGDWEIVDGQQRLTTFVLFLMVCRALPGSGKHAAFSMIERFATVGYDHGALKIIGSNLGGFLEANERFDERNPPSDEQIIEGLSLPREKFARSQKRMVLALLCFHQAFQKGTLDRGEIGDYIAAVMTAHCSHHLTKDKAVAVNIFEMHNTRGVPLTTLEKVKAMLMKFVYDHGGKDRELKVSQIQAEFGEIYRMEEQLAEGSFRGKMTMEQLLRLHLRVVDDGTKKDAESFNHPPLNADPDAILAYVDRSLHFIDAGKAEPKDTKDPKDGVRYAFNLAKEFKKSVRIVSKTLPAWDKDKPLVGDVLILDWAWSYQFFLIVCRRLESEANEADGRIGHATLLLWEKLLFTRDFHGEYKGLSYRDNFAALFAACWADEHQLANQIKEYLKDGFRPNDHTKGLQSIVLNVLNVFENCILTNAFNWWKEKMTYAIYKYEISKGAKIREVMKGSISVEHILSQNWRGIKDRDDDLKKMTEDEWAVFCKKIDGCINGIGNLLLITPSENTSVGNRHPADKEYNDEYGGSYEDHNNNPEKWRKAEEWPNLIEKRGNEILEFMRRELICHEFIEKPPSSLTDDATAEQS